MTTEYRFVLEIKDASGAFFTLSFPAPRGLDRHALVRRALEIETELCAGDAPAPERKSEPEPDTGNKRPRVDDETYGGIVIPARKDDSPHTCAHPVCELKVSSRCKCRLSDMTCEAGHQWHRHGDRVVLGPSPHARRSGNTFVCPLC